MPRSAVAARAAVWAFRSKRKQLASIAVMARRDFVLGMFYACMQFAVGCTSTDLVANNCTINGQPCKDQMIGGAGGGGSESFDTLDLLFVVDNTASMAATQVQLAQQLPEMIRVLTTGQVDADGDLEFAPVTDMHIAFVSTDMGAPGITGLPDCGDDTGRPLGDDALFVSNPSATSVLGQSCDMLPSFVPFEPGVEPTVQEFLLHQAGCLAVVGTDGCRHVMPLEAALKALWARNDPSVTFLRGVGHGLDVQADFVREDALLGIILVTDDDDCSTGDVTLLAPADQLFAGDPLSTVDRNLRCMSAPNRLHPLGRYETALGMLKGGLLRRLFLGVIAGVPPDLATRLSAARIPLAREAAYREVLDDPRMQQVIDPASVTAGARDLTAACGHAYPPRRLVELARRLEEHAAVASICDDLSVPMFEMTRALARVIDPTTSL